MLFALLGFELDQKTLSLCVLEAHNLLDYTNLQLESHLPNLVP